MRGSKVRTSKTLGFKKLQQSKEATNVANNQNLLAKQLKQFAILQKQVQTKDMDPDSSILTNTKTPPNPGK